MMKVKRLFSVAVALLSLLTVQAQQKRLVLVEEFTNVGCGPCAAWSPVLDSAIRYRLGDVIAIKYHSGYPDPADPFYLEEKEVHQAKVDFYHVTGVPTTFVNGSELSERSFNMMNTAISYCNSLPARFDLQVAKQLADHELSVSVSLSPLADETGANIRLHVAAIEEHIDMHCSNGEEELNYTLRKMLTGADGYELNGETLTAGETYTYEGTCSVEHFYHESELGVVAFIQNMDTHEILATAYSGPNAEGENRLALMNLFDTPDEICSPEFYGKVLFRNDGANTITSATLNVKVNGRVKQYPWTGSLEYLNRDTLAFDGMTSFALATAGTNEVEVWFSDINATEATSNTRTLTFNNSVQLTYGAQLRLYTDKKPEETTWKLYNSAGDVVLQGGPYTEPRKFVTEKFELYKDDCYTLELLDAGGDGIKGAYGNGYYQLFQVNENGTTTRVKQGDYDGAVCDINFNLTGAPKANRLVLIEEFTNTSCDPCAEFSPALNDLIYRRMEETVAITYHWYFPSAHDPFYLANPDEATARAAHYGITGVPAIFFDGERGHTQAELIDAPIDYCKEQPKKMNIETEASLDDQQKLNVKVSLQPVSVTDGQNLRLFVVAVEERIEFDESQPNGERSWNYVMRKMLPDAGGQPLEAELTKVTPYQYEYSWTADNLLDPNELGIVTFVQDISTNEVLATVYTPRPTGSTKAAKILKVIDTPDRICTPEFTSGLVIRNTGAETLTSANINVSINGSVQTTPWTGVLEPLAITTVHTPLYTDFALTDEKTNAVEIWLSDLNGSSEESVHASLTLENAVAAQNAVQLTIMTDNMPEEITWTLLNSAGDVMDQGGPYTEARKRITHLFNIDSDDCYTLEFEDAGGNGITGEYGRGYYMLHEVAADGKKRLLVQADYATALHDVYFSVHNAATSGIEDLKADNRQGYDIYDLQGRKATEGGKGILLLRQKGQADVPARKVIK